MAYTAIVEFILHLDNFTLFNAKHQSEYRLSFNISHKKELKTLADKIKPKTYFAQCYKTFGDSTLATTDGVNLTTYPLKMNKNQTSKSQKSDINAVGLFRIDLPCYPNMWTRPVFLTVELFASPQVVVGEG